MKTNNKISIFGLWHLGTVTAACCAGNDSPLSHNLNVVAYDESKEIINNLKDAKSPIYEPELELYLSEGIKSKNLEFTDNLELACDHSDIIWITYDTPVEDDDSSNTQYVYTRIRRICDTKKNPAIIIISSQLPVGTCKQFSKEYPHHIFVCIPENLRLGKAINSFLFPTRTIIGCNDIPTRKRLTEMFPLFLDIIFMSPESAEMVKHALNSYLALSITFINEIAALSETVGANVTDVSLGLTSDPRIGKNAYLKPGAPIAGGTLLRDVTTLNNLKNQQLHVISAIKESNSAHKKWYLNQLTFHFGNSLKNQKIVLLGLTYTTGTNTLRRSLTVELYNQLKSQNVDVYVYDPTIKELPSEYSYIKLIDNLLDYKYNGYVVFTHHPIFKDLNWNDILIGDVCPLVLDINGYLFDIVGSKYSSIVYKKI